MKKGVSTFKLSRKSRIICSQIYAFSISLKLGGHIQNKKSMQNVMIELLAYVQGNLEKKCVHLLWLYKPVSVIEMLPLDITALNM